MARGEVRGGRGVLLMLLPIAGGDGWLDPLGVEVSASAGGCGRRGWGDGSLLGRQIRDLAVQIEWEKAAVVGGVDPREGEVDLVGWLRKTRKMRRLPRGWIPRGIWSVAAAEGDKQPSF